ncbi:MAG TPA: hypothetical protein VE526_17020 [Solirubrobacteraceae bacterium]|jgi:hypothetical protein|nr:hypothetical protein [Solirubrobacteraceae bacterium]
MRPRGEGAARRRSPLEPSEVDAILDAALACAEAGLAALPAR